MDMKQWVVEPNAAGTWDIRNVSDGKQVGRESTRALAEDLVRKKGRGIAGGVHVEVHDFRGRRIAQFEVQGKKVKAPAARGRGTTAAGGRHAAPKSQAPRRAQPPGEISPRPGFEAKEAEASPTPTPDEPVNPRMDQIRPAVGLPQEEERLQAERAKQAEHVDRAEQVNPVEEADQSSTLEKVEQQGGTWDKVIEWVFPIGAAMGSSWLSPEVAEAGGGGWVGVFFATLTWSLGCAGATFAVVKGIRPPELFGWIAASLLGAWCIAVWIGVGVLDVWPSISEGGGHPIARVILAFVYTAWVTYGLVGFFVSGGIGIWLGFHVAKRVPT
jgi:hypothetical protein